MLTPKFEEALQYAASIHSTQKRKGTQIPYVAHLLAVASLVLEHGANEDEAIGALLHDAGEDCGGQARIDDIRLRFGNAAADIVLGCSDTLEEQKPVWKERKKKYLAHLPEASASVRLVSAADKLHNARCILKDYRVCGEKLWPRFAGGKEGTLWYYRSLVNVFKKTGPHDLADELERVVLELESVNNARLC